MFGYDYTCTQIGTEHDITLDAFRFYSKEYDRNFRENS